ncbi:hypothetical protein AB0C77_11220, partial [Streptomyces sp. NPDC048629]
MDRKPQTRLAACPGCAEPLESGDRFCGACGYALTAAQEPPSEDRPTVVLGATAPAPAGAQGEDPDVAWPAPAPRAPGDQSTPTLTRAVVTLRALGYDFPLDSVRRYAEAVHPM